MDKDELLDILVYDYLKKKGLSNTAIIFQNESQITGQTPPVCDQEPHGFLYDHFIKFCDEKYNTRQPMPATSCQSQAPNFGAIMKNTPQIIRDGYSIQHIASFTSRQKLLSCDFSSDGNILASGGESGKPFICYMDTSQSVTTSETHLSTILEVRFLPGSTIFATSSADKTVKLWDANRPARLLFDAVGHNGTVRSIDFHPLGGLFCSSDICDLITVWDLNQLVAINSLRIDSFMAGSLVRFQPGSGKLLAVATQNVITILEFPSLVVKNRLQGHVKDIKSICWDVTGEMIASASKDDVRVWSLLMDGKCSYDYVSKGKRFHSVIFHPQYHNVLVVGGFQCLELLIPETGLRHIKGASNLSITGLAATTAQSKYIASASNDSVVKLWK